MACVFLKEWQGRFEVSGTHYTSRSSPQTAQSEAGPANILGSSLDVPPKAPCIPDEGTPVATDAHQLSPGTFRAVGFSKEGRVRWKKMLEDLEEHLRREGMDRQACVPQSRHAQQFELELPLSGTKIRRIHPVI